MNWIFNGWIYNTLVFHDLLWWFPSVSAYDNRNLSPNNYVSNIFKETFYVLFKYWYYAMYEMRI